MLRAYYSITAFLITSILMLTSFAQAEEVDLELVLAMDASGSISNSEYILQLEGTYAAFSDPVIHNAIASGPLGKIAVTAMLWSDASYPKVNTGWHILYDAESANAFANLIRRFQLNDDNTVMVGGGGTGIGAGIEEALKLIGSNQFEGLRKVVDVSGDGVESEFWFSKTVLLRDAKRLANAQMVTVNGLPIMTRNFPDLDDYYIEKVITGPGAFIVRADSFEDFGRAIRQKLLREISSSVAVAE